MTLTDIMSVGMHDKYVDDSSSSSSSSDSSDSDSDDASSLHSSSSSSSNAGSSSPASPPLMTKKSGKTMGKKKAPRGMGAKGSDPDEDTPKKGKGRATIGKKRASPMKTASRATSAKKQKVQTKTSMRGKGSAQPPPPSSPPPPPPPPQSPPPPPPPLPLTHDYESSDSSSSSSGSSESSSSSDSDEMEESMTARPPPPPPTTTAKAKAPRAKKVASGQPPLPAAGIGADALKVKLKLPPGFIAKHPDGNVLKTSLSERGKLKLQVTNSKPPAAKKQRTSPAAKPRKKATPKASTSGAAVAMGAVDKTPTARGKKSTAAAKGKKAGTAGTQLAPPPSTAAGGVTGVPVVGSILPELIPKGATIPESEVRGKRELSLCDPSASPSQPDEVPESEIPADFNDPFAAEADALRNLDLFYFCDENGNAIGLEILEKPKEQRPRIMGFGTVVQHLPPAQRPIPVKIILPSPAFPSRSRKRQRSDSGAESGKNAKARSTGTKKSPKKMSTKAKASTANANQSGFVDEPMPQVDGTLEDATAFLLSNEKNIFDRNVSYQLKGSRLRTRRIRQLDGQSDHSDSSQSGSGSDDSSSRSGSDSERERRVDSDSDSLSSQGSGSNSGSESDEDERSSRSGSTMSEREVEPAPSPSVLYPKSKAKTSKPSPGKPSMSTPTKAKTASTALSPTKLTDNPDVNELMRTDREGVVEPKGTSDELNLMECGFRHPPQYKRLRVWLPEITDWCLDYSEGDPTLWVITPHAWYKIGGPLAGMLPHPSYRSKFQHVRKLFEASYLVAYVLKEWLPINKKVSYRSTLQQIVELSLKGRYPVSAWFLMENSPFIQNQITDLVADKDSYLDSMFIKQLQRWHDGYKTREEKAKKELAEREERRSKREDERLKRKQQAEEERRKVQEQRDEERKQKEVERKYPIEDSELLEEGPCDPYPVSETNLWRGLDGHMLGDLIMTWQAISTFKNFVGLDEISLESLAECFTASTQDEATDLGLIRIFMAFLKSILSEKSFVSPMDDLVVEGSTTVADLFVNTERTYGICERPYLELLNALTWQDILRQLMAKDVGVDASIGNIEPLVGCEIVRQTLYMQNNSVPFNVPVDGKIKGLEDYADIIKRPMDLGTVKQNLDVGQYEGPNGHEAFASDIRLIWDNAILYNGEESEVGRAALALSDIFEQDYERLVTGRIAANKERLEQCERVRRLLEDDAHRSQSRPSPTEIVHGLYGFEFHQLPVAYKLGALSWLCSEFLTLESVRSYMENQAEQEFEVLRVHRKTLADIDGRRKASERARKERELTFRTECINDGIPVNANNHFSDATKQEHHHIQNFYSELHAEKARDDAAFEGEKREADEELRRSLKGVIVRASPLGRDRFHNSYWIFANDTHARLFIEKNDTGDFNMCASKSELESLIAWCNPKGIRELDLQNKLKAVKEDLVSGFTRQGDANGDSCWSRDVTIPLALCPLPGDVGTQEKTVVLKASSRVGNSEVLRQMLLEVHEQLKCIRITQSEWDPMWRERVTNAKECSEFRSLLGDLEDALVGVRRSEDTVRMTWKRKRREWRLSLEGSQTISQVVFMLHLFLAECLNVEAFQDLASQLDRKDWIKLRAKECRNFIPEIGKRVVYFGDGHAQALKEDSKGKKKKFTRKSDQPVLHRTLLFSVAGLTYHRGGGDPYALVVLERVDDDKIVQSIQRDPGSELCPQPSPLQRLARVCLRILAKVKMQTDAEPFLEPVSDRDFPEYKEIIPHPMDLSKMTTNARANKYTLIEQFLSDMKLIRSNCELFCEGRFPTLPPLARSIVELAEGMVKKSLKEIRSYEAAIKSNGPDDPATANGTAKLSPDRSNGHLSPVKDEVNCPMTSTDAKHGLVVILRLENRLPEYIVDWKRYEAAVSRTWRYGEKFRMLFRNPQGYPGEYYGGIAAGSLPFDSNGLLPWEALRVVWDEDDGSDDNRINPWEAEVVPEGRKTR